MSEQKVDLKAGLAQVDAEKDICGEYNGPIKRILKALCGVQESVYKRGDKFSHSGGTVTLACIGGTTMLMVFDDGRWGGANGGVEVGNVYCITEAELVGICAGFRNRYTLKEVDDE